MPKCRPHSSWRKASAIFSSGNTLSISGLMPVASSARTSSCCCMRLPAMWPWRRGGPCRTRPAPIQSRTLWFAQSSEIALWTMAPTMAPMIGATQHQPERAEEFGGQFLHVQLPLICALRESRGGIDCTRPFQRGPGANCRVLDNSLRCNLARIDFPNRNPYVQCDTSAEGLMATSPGAAFPIEPGRQNGTLYPT